MTEVALGNDTRFELTVSDVTGAVGDSITVLPIVVAVAALTDLHLPTLLLGFAVFQIVWGVHYDLPISVEPMKALAALVIAGSLTTGEFVTAGAVAGVALLAVGRTGTLSRITPYVGEPVVRGIQVAVALMLARTGVELGAGNPTVALVAVLITGVVVALGYRRASALVVLAFGVVLAELSVGVPSPRLPQLALGFSPVLTETTLSATLGQLAMTVGNAAVATSLLLADLFDADVAPDELATSMGVMNLLAVPFGAMPMCHGSGGVAGKYAFGARNAGANLVLGIMYALAAIFAASVVAAFPLSVLGVVLVVVAFSLGRSGLDTENRWFAVGVGLLGLLTNVGIAFVVGVGAWWVRNKL
ncbi:sulfate transporter [Haladaptatus sp. W1]|uniref:putative sulfate/molybdate transporter n=1 Tax=Haladaptatus sp. W1 TaxID=1897478 RepID=UPI0008499ED0|nr:putative sulfate/molybdate transporter [Haladaptatus sp. W1]ODR80759.1 sulfate transporter [Haladaptatus sp. W1]